VSAQTELPLAPKRETRSEAAERKARHIFLLESILMKRTAMPWMTSRQIADHVQTVHGLAWNERYVREMAGMSTALCSAPGSPGYAFAELLSAEELQHCGRAKCSQGRLMFKDGVRMLRAAALKRKTTELLAPQSAAGVAPAQHVTTATAADAALAAEDAKRVEHDEALRRYMAGEDLR
jgi:hypothetical protein